MSNEIKIYVADLAAYNAGHLHGVWIDACSDIDNIWKQVKTMLAESPVEGSEEFSIHAFEGFDGYQISEHEGIEAAHETACFIEEFPDFAGELLNNFGGDLDEARSMAEDNYCGCYSSIADYAQELTEETGDIPQHLEHYVDYERMARDMEMSGDIFTIETGYQEVHIFYSH